MIYKTLRNDDWPLPSNDPVLVDILANGLSVVSLVFLHRPVLSSQHSLEDLTNTVRDIPHDAAVTVTL